MRRSRRRASRCHGTTRTADAREDDRHGSSECSRHGLTSEYRARPATSVGAGCRGPPGRRQARSNGPASERARPNETRRGNSTPVRFISAFATRRKWCSAGSSSNTTSTAGRTPWSSVGRWGRWGGGGKRSSAGRGRGGRPSSRGARRGASTRERTATSPRPGAAAQRHRAGRSAGGRRSGSTARRGGVGNRRHTQGWPSSSRRAGQVRHGAARRPAVAARVLRSVSI